MRYNVSIGKKQFKLATIMLIITGLLIISCLLVIVYAMRARIYNERSIEISKLHMKYTDIAAGLTDGSHTLTEEVRLFAETGDITHLNKYFDEAKIYKHRDKAMEELAETSASVAAVSHMETSMRYSLMLMNREYYSMKLTALAYNISDNQLPDEVSSVKLSDDDLKLSAEEMKSKARIMLFDDEYMDTKRKITSGTTLFLNSVKEESQNEYISLTKKVVLYSNVLRVTIGVMAVLILIVLIFLYAFVISPIAKAARSISKGNTIKMPLFLQELESLSAAYNGLLTNNAQLVERLRVIAETDVLTKLGNRAAYNNFCKMLVKDGGEAMLFVFDVNDLREMNNNHGHDDGDKLLQTAANCISDVFGKCGDKNCFRIGGDEFVAFICGEEESKAKEYIEKFDEKLKIANVDIAVGYKYEKDIGNTSIQQMFSEADKMMYINKAKIKGLI